jgi:hypothetical protein
MVSSNTQTVASYLKSLPQERREAIGALRKLVLQRLPAGFEECMAFGRISYVVPLSRYPKTYNGQPLMLASLASQKQSMSLDLMTVYGDPDTQRWFAEGFRRAGKRLDMGKACVHFKALDDLPLDVVGDAIARVSVDEYVALYERARGLTQGTARARGKRVAKVAIGKVKATKKAAKKAGTKKAAKKRAATPQKPAKKSQARG